MKTVDEAKSVVLANSADVNVFTPTESRAQGLAGSVSSTPGLSTLSERHVTDKYGNPTPLNLPHYHALYKGVHGLTHVFYGMPYPS